MQITLEEGEYFTGLVAHRNQASGDNLVKGITFITNRRRVRAGGGAGGVDNLTNNPSDMKMVAFCGNVGDESPFVRKEGVLEIGFYIKPLGWKTRGAPILIRELVRQNRARQQVPSSSELGITTQRLIGFDDGVFRNIMKYL